MGNYSQETYVTFSLDSDRFCTAVEHVREVVRPSEYTHLPSARANILGVINVRGKILPVLDACLILLGRPNGDPNRGLVLILHSTHGEIGLLVDGVHGLLNHASKAVSPPTDMIHHEAVMGMLEHEGRCSTLVDLRRLVDGTVDDHTTAPASL